MLQTIMGVESIGGLRVLAVNILGRCEWVWGVMRGSNLRYVALNTLCKVMEVDAQMLAALIKPSAGLPCPSPPLHVQVPSQQRQQHPLCSLKHTVHGCEGSHTFTETAPSFPLSAGSWQTRTTTSATLP